MQEKESFQIVSPLAQQHWTSPDWVRGCYDFLFQINDLCPDGNPNNREDGTPENSHQ